MQRGESNTKTLGRSELILRLGDVTQETKAFERAKEILAKAYTKIGNAKAAMQLQATLDNWITANHERQAALLKAIQVINRDKEHYDGT